MRITHTLTAVLPIPLALAIGLACGPVAPQAPRDRLLENMSPHDAAIDQACDLTARRCTLCHDIDRVVWAQVTEPAQWERYIDRMRRMRGSGISVSDGDTILRCLVFRSFGEPGVRGLRTAGPTE